LQALVAKILLWQLQRPVRDQLIEFHRALESTPHNGAPADEFIQNLNPVERMAVFSHFRRVCAPPGKTLLNPGKRPADLYLVVSGVVKESTYEMLSHKPSFRRDACRVLQEADSFGEVYPFSEDTLIQPHVVASSRTELAVVSRSRLIRACRRYPNVERGLVRLCRIRSTRKADPPFVAVRKGSRYSVPTRMRIEIEPSTQNTPPLVMKGYCRDLSVSGVFFIPEASEARFAVHGGVNGDDVVRRKVRVTIPLGELSIAISGRIVRKRNVVFNGVKIQSLGIQFAEMPPRQRGLFFAFAESAKSGDWPPRPSTGSGTE
jgi:hypothetical protein